MSNGSGLVLQLQPKITALASANFLIVTNENSDIKAIIQILESEKISFTYDVIYADRAPQNLIESEYSAILYNYCLSGQDQTSELLQKQISSWCHLNPQIPLILITGILGDEIAVKLAQSGISGYVLKHKLDQLPQVIEKTLTDFANRRQEYQEQQDLIEQQQEYINQLEAEKQAKQEHINQLEAEKQAKQEHISHLNHELRSPISSILGFAGMLKEQFYGPLNAKQLQYVSAIVTTGQYLLDLVNNYLVLAKIEANKQEINLEKLAVEDVCQAALCIVAEKAKQKGLEIIFTLADDVDFCIADPVRLKQILVNLIYNAIKFTDRGSVTLQVSLQDDLLHFAVIDTGIGISDADLKKLFQPFQQIKSHYEGTGLGLVLSRKLAWLHGGNITVTSEAGKGSCFTLHIPRYNSHQLPATN